MQKNLLYIVFLAAVGVYCYFRYQAETGLTRARDLIATKQWKEARGALDSFLWLYPSHGGALILKARAMYEDVALNETEAATAAVALFEQVPEESPRALEARVKTGDLRLISLRSPISAEAAFRSALVVEPECREALYGMWRILELTDRWSEAEPVFWRSYSIAPPNDRALVLEHWFMSQFFTESLNMRTDEDFGIYRAGNLYNENIWLQRFTLFRESEPQSAIHYSAIARWTDQMGGGNDALVVIDEAIEKLPLAERTHPFLLTAEMTICRKLGLDERVQNAFELWPEGSENTFDYLKWKAIIELNYRGELEQAIADFDSALSIWPGPLDWRLRAEKAGCLRQLGRSEEADQERKHSEYIYTELINNEMLSKLREALRTPNRPESIEAMALFYQKLGRPREAECWRAELKRIGLAQAPSIQSPSSGKSKKGKKSTLDAVAPLPSSSNQTGSVEGLKLRSGVKQDFAPNESQK